MNFPHQTDELRRATAIQSTYIENVLRHRMVADLCSELWKRNCNAALQVFNSEVDNSGFDLVLKLGLAIRYVQIKQSHDGKVPPYCSTRASFSLLTGSCIVLIAYDWNDLSISGYQFYGQYPHQPMKSIDGFKAAVTPGRRNVEGKKHIRSHYRNVPVKHFTTRIACEQLLDELFPSYLLPKDLSADDPLLALAGTWPVDGQAADEYISSLRDGWDEQDEG